jgi:hypothetical protein
MKMETSSYALATCVDCPWRDQDNGGLQEVLGRGQLHHEDTGHQVHVRREHLTWFERTPAPKAGAK